LGFSVGLTVRSISESPWHRLRGYRRFGEAALADRPARGQPLSSCRGRGSMTKARGSRAFQNARLKKRHAKELQDAAGKLSQAIALHQRGLISNAQSLYRQILQAVPDHFDALYLLAVSEFQSGHHEEAVRLLDRALTVEPRSAAAHSTRGAALNELRRFDEALASCDRALASAPDDADALNIRGNALIGLSRFEDAAASYQRAIALKPSFVGAINNCGNALRQLGRLDEALAAFDRAIAIDSRYADAFGNRGNVLKDLGRYDGALADYERAVAIRPQYAEAHSNRGIILLELNRPEEALTSFDRAIAIKPALAEACNGRGNALRRLLRLGEALASFDRAIALKPDFAEALGNRGIVLAELTRSDEAIESFDRAIAAHPGSAVGISNKIIHLDFTAAGFAQQQAARKEWWQHIGSRIAQNADLNYPNTRDSKRRIIVGYVSADFKQHSAAVTIRPILRNHDRTRFHIICYSCSAAEDDFTRDFQQLAATWRNAAALSDEGLAEQIRRDQVDILVDLSGHSAGNRLGVFARKPAPIQVTAWGHATGTGLHTIDYLFSDPVAIPAAVRHLFAEKIYDLPCLVTIEHPSAALRDVAAPVLANGHVTFGMFNRVSKISDAAVGVWAQILCATPRSTLLIKDVALESEAVRAQLREKFAMQGIAADRIGFLGGTSRDEHLAAFKHVDICLDPFPWGGGVSTWEAVHMGVPVIAMLGNGVSSRVAGAIMSAIGLSNWVADSTDSYLSIAVKFASQPDILAKLRHELPQRIANSDAGNPATYTRAVENAYQSMWRDYCRRQA
jgi:predicted O-linked N-acetylglucosamine transferase (SPINDLY family)